LGAERLSQLIKESEIVTRRECTPCRDRLRKRDFSLHDQTAREFKHCANAGKIGIHIGALASKARFAFNGWNNLLFA